MFIEVVSILYVSVLFQEPSAETAFINFLPNSAYSDYANEVYDPPLSPDDDPAAYLAKGKYYRTALIKFTPCKYH